MKTETTDSSASRKMALYRARLRAQGLRPVQIWVPDTRAAQFRKEAKRQSLLVSKSANEKAMMEWLESIADTEGWEE